MKEQLKSIDERAKEELSHIDDAKLLEDFRVRFLGKKGEITSILKQMGKLSAEERPVIGQLANKVRADIENALNKRKEELKSKMEQVRLTEEAIDFIHIFIGDVHYIVKPEVFHRSNGCAHAY